MTYPPTCVCPPPIDRPIYMFTNIKPNHAIRFANSDGWIGTLDFNGSSMTFEGNAEESAMEMFNFLANFFSTRLEEEYKRGQNDLLHR